MAVGAAGFIRCNHKPTIRAGGWVGISQGSAAGNAGAFAQGIRRSAVFTCDSAQSFGKRVGRAKSMDGAIDYSPHVFAELHTFEILGQVIQPAEQAERVAKGGKSRMAEAGSYTHPGLSTHFDHNAIFHRTDVDR